MKIARYIDHAVLKPAMTPDEVKMAIQLGIDHGVFSVCVQPRDIALAVKMCEGTDTLVSCVLDFPHGCGGARLIYDCRPFFQPGLVPRWNRLLFWSAKRRCACGV